MEGVKTLGVVLSAEEYAEVRVIAATAGTSMSAWAAQRIRTHLKTRIAETVEQKPVPKAKPTVVEMNAGRERLQKASQALQEVMERKKVPGHVPAHIHDFKQQTGASGGIVYRCACGQPRPR